MAEGLKYLHSLDIIHGLLKGVSKLPNPSGRLTALLSLFLYYQVMLILWWQANIVVKKERAHLTDYGLYPVYSDPELNEADTPGVDGMSRWQAPEITLSENHSVEDYTKPGDVFSFGMVALEIFTGEVPFNGSAAMTVSMQIAKGKRPKISGIAKQRGLRGGRKTLIKECWRESPEGRPKMEDAVGQLKEAEGEAKYNSLFCGIF